MKSASSPSSFPPPPADQSEVVPVCFPFHDNEKEKTALQLGGEYKTVTKKNPNLAELFLCDLRFKSDRQRCDSAVSGTLFSMPFFKPGLKIAHLYVLTWGGA